MAQSEALKQSRDVVSDVWVLVVSGTTCAALVLLSLLSPGMTQFKSANTEYRDATSIRSA